MKTITTLTNLAPIIIKETNFDIDEKISIETVGNRIIIEKPDVRTEIKEIFSKFDFSEWEQEYTPENIGNSFHYPSCYTELTRKLRHLLSTLCIVYKVFYSKESYTFTILFSEFGNYDGIKVAMYKIEPHCSMARELSTEICTESKEK